MEQYQVVMEGKSDVLLLRAILNIPADDPKVTFVAAGGWSSADSYARTVLIQDKANIALVVDADSTHAADASNRRLFLERSLGDVTLHKKFCVVVIEPEIETLLFQDHFILEQVVGRRVSDREYKLAASKPKAVLTDILGSSNLYTTLEDNLSRIDFTPLAHNSYVQQLQSFLPRSKRKASAVR